MRKTYRYRNLTSNVSDDERVNFTVEFISDGNTCQTLVNVPGPIDPEIQDAGTIYIGKGKDLRGDTTICFSDVANLIPEEDFIKINFKINDQIICEHSNEKAEEKQPIIILFINFPIS